jgi:hypothetical protein
MNKQGQGRHTPNKIAVFEAFFTQNISVVRHAIKAPQYFGFDMNAGCGVNKIAGCIGSPLAFRLAAQKAGMPDALCFCCELDFAAATELQYRTQDDKSTFVTIGRNQDFVEEIPEIIREHRVNPAFAYGSILIDPNNHRRNGIPYDGLRLLAEKCPRIDVIFNFPQLAMKRVTCAVASGSNCGDSADDCYDIDELPAVIGKKHLWITQTKELGNFAIVVGRNTPNVNFDKKTGLVPWDSDLGVYYRDRCRMKVDDAARKHSHVADKLLGQRRLWD